MNGLQVLGTGRCLPGRRVTNEDFARTLDTSDEWIAGRTGIRQRYFCAEGETAASLAAEAARRALDDAGISPADVGVCIAATFTADRRTPALACEVQAALGLPETALCLDVNAACTGFLTALETARCMLASSSLAAPCALVIGSECISRALDFSDRSTCVLFGDGAGAAVVRLSDENPYACMLGARAETDILYAGGAACADRTLHMQGKAVFRFASETVPQCVKALLDRTGKSLDDIAYVVCHQANGRIIDHVQKKLGAPAEKFYKNMQRYANTSAASIPIALDEMAERGLLHRGQSVICVGFGAGLTWGGALLTV